MDFEITRDMIVVQSYDPRVTYSHGWEKTPGESKICSGGSFHRAYCKGASARFEFEGSHIWVVGHKSASHGVLKVNIDGQPGIATINAWEGAREVIPFRNLFEHKFPKPGPHWIEVVNDLSGSEITIDSFAFRPMAPNHTWQPPQGLGLVTVADNDPRIKYTGVWQQCIGNGNHTGSGSYHITYTRGATACVSFESSHFWIIGDLASDHGRYTISVDGGPPEVFPGHDPVWRKHIILYERQFASVGRHRIVMHNEEDKTFGLDAVIYEAPMLNNADAAPGTCLADSSGEQAERAV